MMGYKLIRADELSKLKEELEIKDKELKKCFGELSKQYASKANLYKKLGMVIIEKDSYNLIIEKLFDKDFKKAIGIFNRTKSMRIKNKKELELLKQVRNIKKHII